MCAFNRSEAAVSRECVAFCAASFSFSVFVAFRKIGSEYVPVKNKNDEAAAATRRNTTISTPQLLGSCHLCRD